MAYNGWSNYETWAAKLWMDNEEGGYRYWQSEARRARDASSLAAQLKDEHEEALPDVSGLAGDLLWAAFGEIDWYEIAESLIEDNEEEDDEDSEDD